MREDIVSDAVWNCPPGRPRAAVPTLFLRASWCGMQSFDRRLHLRRNRIRILYGQPGSGNWFTNTHLQRLALDVVGVHWQQVECVDECDRHDIGPRLDCQKECAR